MLAQSLCASASQAAAACACQQLPGSVRLLQVFKSCLRYHSWRSVAQVARHEHEPPTTVEAQLQARLDPMIQVTAEQLPSLHDANQQQHHAATTATAAAQQPQQLPQHQHEQHKLPLSPVVQPLYSPPTGVKKTFYKRKLPCPPATEFSSAAGASVCGVCVACVGRM